MAPSRSPRPGIRRWNNASGACFVRGDAEYIPLRSGRFDAVFSECSISLFSDKPAAIRQIADLLRPGGRFGLSDVALATRQPTIRT